MSDARRQRRWARRVARACLSVVTILVASLLIIKLVDLAAGVLVGSEKRYAMALPATSHIAFDLLDFKFDVYANNLGLREQPLRPERDPSVYRVLCIGDSFTMGWGVAPEETWVRLLGARLKSPDRRPVQTVNGGNAGASPNDYAELATEAIPTLQPDLVVVCLLQGEDLGQAAEECATKDRLVREARLAAMGWFPSLWRLAGGGSAVGQTFVPMQMPAEATKRIFAERAREAVEQAPAEARARFDALAAEIREAYLSGRINPVMIDLKSTAAEMRQQEGLWRADPKDPLLRCAAADVVRALKRIRSLAAKCGAKTVVVSVPGPDYVNAVEVGRLARLGYPNDTTMVGSCAPDALVKSICDEAGVRCISTTEAIRAADTHGEIYFPTDGHFTIEGNRVFADAIAPEIQSKVIDKK